MGHPQHTFITDPPGKSKGQISPCAVPNKDNSVFDILIVLYDLQIYGSGILHCSREMRMLKQTVLHGKDFIKNAILVQLSLSQSQITEGASTSIRRFGIIDGPEDSWADIWQYPPPCMNSPIMIGLLELDCVFAS